MANGGGAARAVPSSKVVFIASSKEAKNRAQLLVDALSKAGFSPLPWWENAAFPLGSNTFDSLRDLSQSADASIFLLTKDDKIWYRGAEVEGPRDNVVLELGLFASHLGPKRSLILADGGAKLPSDLLGITYQSLDVGIEEASRRIVSHLEAEFDAAPPPSPIMIISEPNLIPAIAGKAPADWLMRAFYFGTVGAKAWLSISLDPRYQDDASNRRLAEKIRDLVEQSGKRFRTFVSLGPGDARIDERTAINLRIHDSEVRYVPVDISDGLLLHAARKLKERVSVPVGILADFEDNLDFVLDQITRKTRGPYLYALLGNTFGNFDTSETAFIDGFRWHLRPDDMLILGVAVRKPGGAPIDARKMSQGAIEFYAHGAACHLGVSVAEVKARFVEMVEFVPISDGSEIPNTETFKFCVKDDQGSRPCANLRRFDLKSLTEWLEGRGLKVRSHHIPENGPYDLAVLALQNTGD